MGGSDAEGSRSRPPGAAEGARVGDVGPPPGWPCGGRSGTAG